MKRLLQSLPVLLLVMGPLCFVAADTAESADWVQVWEDGEGVYYADRDTALKNTSVVREARELGVLKNHLEIQRYLEVVEYDCDANKRRILHTVTHNKQGEANFRSTMNASWGPVGQQQKTMALFTFTCRR